VSNSSNQLRKQQQLAAYAHYMRLAPTEPEAVLWRLIRCRQLGVQFRRQVILDRYIVDFFAPAAKLVVEVDGAHHTQQHKADARRDRALTALGLRVVRLPARLVYQQPRAAVQLITQALAG
jgi:very-short-patch-repair endonuclease